MTAHSLWSSPYLFLSPSLWSIYPPFVEKGPSLATRGPRTHAPVIHRRNALPYVVPLLARVKAGPKSITLRLSSWSYFDQRHEDCSSRLPLTIECGVGPDPNQQSHLILSRKKMMTMSAAYFTLIMTPRTRLPLPLASRRPSIPSPISPISAKVVSVDWLLSPPLPDSVMKWKEGGTLYSLIRMSVTHHDGRLETILILVLLRSVPFNSINTTATGGMA